MADEMEVAPSADNGNVPVDAPSEPVVPPVEEPAKPAEPVKVEAQPLYDLPDGRKVDAATLAKEFKENFLPEFTRKSQALAEIERAKNTTEPVESPYADPNYIPQSYEEVIAAAEARALATIEAKQTAEIERRQAVENAVAEQLNAIKQTDPNLDENALFLHANKYNFKDLTLAHKNMKDMAELVKTVQQTTVKNIAKRSDPVSTTNQPSGAKLNPTQFENAVAYMRALNGN